MGRGDRGARTDAGLPYIGAQLSLLVPIGVEQIEDELYLFVRDDGWAAHPNDGRMETEL